MVVRSRSRLRAFQLFFWLFLGATFADAANLDDLILPGIVLHDDEDATAAGPQQGSPGGTPCSPHSGTVPAAQVRIFVDQDSPSLAADADSPALVSQFLYESQAAVFRESPFGLEPLHIKLRTLLL